MTTYSVGDVQGCYGALRRLLDTVNFCPIKDKLWLAGDLANRGPESLETLRYVRSLGACATAVLGNHDLHLIARYFGKKASRLDTLDAVLSAKDAQELVTWLRHRPLLHAEAGWVMVHAGIHPAWDLAQAQAYAQAISDRLRSDDPLSFLKTMYGNHPEHWKKSLKPEDQNRLAVNSFTRMRFLQADGGLDFSEKGPPESAPKGLRPWFTAPNRRCRERIIFGHWSSLGRVYWPEYQVWGLDTGAVWGRKLTALVLESKEIVAVDVPEQHRPDALDGD